MSADFSYAVHDAEPVIVTVTVTVTGELDVNSAPELTAALTALVDQGRRHLRVDCRGLRFIDASGLRAFAAVHDRLRELGGELRVQDLSALARRLVELTGMVDILQPGPRSSGHRAEVADQLG